MSNDIEIKKMEADTLFKEKNIPVAYVLWFFLWWLGAHRFYLGRPGSAIAMIFLWPLTLGIWPLLDAYFTYKIAEEHNDRVRKDKLLYVKSGAAPVEGSNV